MKKLFAFYALLLQGLLFGGAWALEYYSSRRMGVENFLEYRNMVLSESFFTAGRISTYGSIFIICAISLGFWAACYISKRHYWAAACMALGSAIALFGAFLTKFGADGLKAYYFFIIAALASLFIQVIVIIFGFDGRPCRLDTEPEGD